MALWRLRATVDDRPGFLSVLTASLALRSVNILSVQVHAGSRGAVDDFLIDAPDGLTADDLLAAVERGRARDPWLCRTEARVLLDPLTEVLAAARRLVRDPDRLLDELADLFMAVVTRTADASSSAVPLAGLGFIDACMVVANPIGGVLVIERAAPAFTAAEYARACALVDVAAEVRHTSTL